MRLIMTEFMEIKCLTKDQQEKIAEEIEQRVAKKRKEGIFTEKEIREIVEMKLSPLPDILDVQSVYESFLYEKDD
jgi:hypothetical protein